MSDLSNSSNVSLRDSSKPKRSVGFAVGTVFGSSDDGSLTAAGLLKLVGKLSVSSDRFKKPLSSTPSTSPTQEGSDADVDCPVIFVEGEGESNSDNHDASSDSPARSALLTTISLLQIDVARTKEHLQDTICEKKALAGSNRQLIFKRNALQAQLAAAEHKNAALAAKLAAVVAQNTAQTRQIVELQGRLHAFTQGVMWLLTSFQDDLMARMGELVPNVNPGSAKYCAQQLRDRGNRKSADLLEELFAKYSALSTAKISLEQNPSAQTLGQIFNDLLASTAVRKSHTGFKAVFGLESATHRAIAKQALAFKALSLANNPHRPQAQVVVAAR